MNRSYKTVSTPLRTTRNTLAVGTPQAATTPAPVATPVAVTVAAPTAVATPQVTPMITEENVKIVKFQAKGKVSAKVKRQRANKRLRRLLCPKTATMAIHELINKETDGKDIEFQVSDDPSKKQFKAETVYQGKVYAGFGPSKQTARNNVAEKVLRDLVIDKMKKCPKKPVPEGDVEMMDTAEEDEVPMTHLASYALHKLFAEWNEQGFEVPDFKLLFSAGAVETNGKEVSNIPAPRAELPANAGSLHPAMLLAQMRPGIQYQELGSQGTAPNVIHCMGVTVDGKQFIGNGKSKKIARRDAARFACQEIFGVVFDPAVLNGK